MGNLEEVLNENIVDVFNMDVALVFRGPSHPIIIFKSGKKMLLTGLSKPTCSM